MPFPLSRRQIYLARWSLVNLKNWPAVIAAQLLDYSPKEIRFRDHTRFLIDPNHSSDLNCIYEVFADRAYHDHLFDDISTSGTVVDVGANIGTFTVHAAKYLVPKGRVIAVEPNPYCVARIHEHARINNLLNISVISAAVADDAARVSLHLTDNSGESSLFTGNRDVIEVAALSTRKCLSLSPIIDLMKIDCEGGEFAMLFGVEPTDWTHVRRLVLEYHLGFDVRYSATIDGLQSRIRALGFSILKAQSAADTRFGYIAAVHN